jgi:hypothetical protein
MIGVREPYTDVEEWTESQKTLLSQSMLEDVVFVGGRMTGKTEVVAHAARARAECGDDVFVVAPKVRMCHMISERIRGPGVNAVGVNRLLPVEGDGSIILVSSHNYQKHADTTDYDRIIADEASYIHDNILRSIHNDTVPTMLAGSPKYPDLGRFSEYARSDSYYTVRTTSFDSEFVDEQHLMDLRQTMDHEQALGELYARYQTDDRGQ